MISHKYELINKGNDRLSLNINILIEHNSSEYFDNYDHVALKFNNNQFEGNFAVYDESRKNIINYLINNNIVKVIDKDAYYDNFILYRIQLTKTATLEVL